MPRYREIDQTNLMLQIDLTNQLLPGTFEHALDYIIDSHIDTSAFDDQYHNDETGASAYDPKSLLKIILYAYSKGILSSRKIESACNENIIFMPLSGDQHPDHSTIADFVSRQCSPIKEIFTQVLFLCAQMDLIGMEYLAVDGCKISSNAAKAVDHLNETIQRIGEFLETHSPRMGSRVRSGEVKSNITEAQTASSRVTTVWR